jgi:spore germination protein YaaH
VELVTLSRPTNRRSPRRWLALALAVLVGGPSLLAPSGVTAGPAAVVSDIDNGITQAAGGAWPVLPDAGTAGDTQGDGPPDGADPGSTPTIQYLQSEEHASDKIDFQPGKRVTVPFTPRAGDDWQVDGQSPRALPAGHADGAQMRAEAPGAIWAAGAPNDLASSGLGSVDEPSGDGSAAAAQPVSSASASSADEPTSAITIGASGLRREVFGFLPYWEIGASSTTLDWRTLSTVAYFSVGCLQSGALDKVNPDGSATTGWGGWTSSKMTSVINAAHKNQTRVVLTISCFAWSSSGATRQARLLGSATARAILARAAAAAVRDRGADGINLDFEPIVAGYSDEFTLLVRSIRSELNKIHAGYQLTFDTMGSIGNQPIADATAPGGADAVFVMGYDYRTASSSSAGSISPLTGPHYDLTDTIKAYTARISPSKVILGVPYYGRAWSTTSDAVNAATLNQAKYGSSAAPTYAQAMDQVALHGRRYDSVEQAPWTAYRKQTCTSTYGCVTSWRELYYDDAASLKLRYDLVNRSSLRGAGIWALGFDGTRPELRTALADKFLADKTAPLTGIVTLAQQQRDQTFRVSWAGWDDSSIARYDVQVSVNGGTWASWLTGTTLTGSLYPGVDGRIYAFRDRATDIRGNVSAWKSLALGNLSVPGSIAVGGFATVATDGLHMRASASTGAAIMTTLSAGDALHVIGGPVSGKGYTWYEVSGPVRQWAPVDPMQVGGWVAAFGNGATNVDPRRPVYATLVNAGITGMQLANGGQRVLTPNSTLRVEWTGHVAFDSLDLRVFRPDGTVLGAVGLGGTGVGTHAFNWDGRVNGTRVPNGEYVLQLRGMRGSSAYTAPSASPVSVAQIARFGIIVANVPPTSVVSFARPASPTKATTLTWKLTFGGPVSRPSLSDIVRTGTATGCVVGAPAGSGSTWTVTVTGCSQGTVTLGMKAKEVFDAVHNWGPATQVNAPTVQIDRSAPVSAAPKVSLRSGVTVASSSTSSGLFSTLTWSAVDPGGAGVLSYDLRRSVDGAAFATLLSGVHTTSMYLALTPGHAYRFEVRARDKAGNLGGWVAGPTIRAYLPQQTYAGLTWKGTWKSATLASCSGGSVRYATAAGASAAYSFTGRAIAWVTTLGPDRGAAKIYVDGVLVTTIDLHATSTSYRRVAFAKSWSAAGTHSLRIVVVATAGRPRVDVDAFEVIR